MFLFPVASVRNYHKCGGLEQQKFIFSQFGRPKFNIDDSKFGSSEVYLLDLQMATSCHILTWYVFCVYAYLVSFVCPNVFF